MADALADPYDVALLLGRDLTSEEEGRAYGILLKASELFRLEARQRWENGRHAPRLKSNGGRVYMPRSVASEIHSVVDDTGRAVTYTQRGQWLDTDLSSSDFATVDYSYDGMVPDVVRLAIADIARFILTVPADAAAGATQTSETAGAFSRSVTYATWAQGGATRLSPDDIALARSFRPVVPRVHVMQP